MIFDTKHASTWSQKFEKNETDPKIQNTTEGRSRRSSVTQRVLGTHTSSRASADLAQNMEFKNVVGKKMTLSDAREELERQGFKIVVDEYSPSVDVPSDVVVGILSSCRWDMLAKVDVVVVVHQVTDLTLRRIETDLADLPNQPYLDDSIAAGSCPPQGVSRVKMTILFTSPAVALIRMRWIEFCKLQDRKVCRRLFGCPRCQRGVVLPGNVHTILGQSLLSGAPLLGRPHDGSPLA